jgi:hypothetical protein
MEELTLNEINLPIPESGGIQHFMLISRTPKRCKEQLSSRVVSSGGRESDLSQSLKIFRKILSSFPTHPEFCKIFKNFQKIFKNSQKTFLKNFQQVSKS